MDDRRRSFWLGGRIPWYYSLFSFLFTWLCWFDPAITVHSPAMMLASVVLALPGILILLWINRLTIDGGTVEIRQPCFRAPTVHPRTAFSKVRVWQSRVLRSGGTRSGGQWNIWVMAKDPVLAARFYLTPSSVVRWRARRIAGALGCPMEDGTEE